MTSRLAEEADLDDRCVEGEAHGTGKFHEIFGRANFLSAAHEFPIGLLADTMHKSESYPFPLYWTLRTL